MMIHCLNSSGSVAVNSGVEMTVLERQRARMKWQQQMQNQQQHLQQGFELYGGEYSVMNQGSEGAAVLSQFQASQMCRDAAGLQHVVKPDPGLDGGWAGFGSMLGVGDGVIMSSYVNDVRTDQPAASSCQMMKTVSCPGPVVGDVTEAKDPILKEKMSLLGAVATAAAKEGSKKRKAEKSSSFKAAVDSDTKEKKIKECAEDGESKITQQNRSNNISKNKSKEEAASADTSKDNSKVSEVKTDYIHVRARRGQATDSHSLAERVRREKISERMKYLQDLVPGCNKITGKAGMLDEIINYVQSLQRQVEFLSMKLATVNPPPVSFSIDNLFGKEVFSPCSSSYPTLGELSQMANSPYIQFSHLEEVVSPGLDLGSYQQPDMGLQRPVPETFIGTPSFIQMQPNPSTWDADLQNLLTMDFQGRSAPFPLQPFTGSTEASNPKMEI